MDNQSLHREYLHTGTAGYAIIKKFHSRYADVLAKISLVDFNDVLHEIFLSLSKTNVDNVRNIDHYMLRAIKLHCWSLLDKAIRQKSIILNSSVQHQSDETERISKEIPADTRYNGQLSELEGADLLVQINLFKIRLNSQEIRLLNFLIDEMDRFEIAKMMELNVNTLDTNIRRLRIKLAEYLKPLGYTHTGLERFI